jgi:hypothetical protein
MLGENDDVAAVTGSVLRNMRKYLEADPRLDTPDRPAVLDTPTAHAFSIGDDEVVAGTADSVAAQIIEQCRAAGAGHFAANFNRAQPPEALKAWYGDFGRHVIPRLRGSSTSALAAAS